MHLVLWAAGLAQQSVWLIQTSYISTLTQALLPWATGEGASHRHTGFSGFGIKNTLKFVRGFHFTSAKRGSETYSRRELILGAASPILPNCSCTSGWRYSPRQLGFSAAGRHRRRLLRRLACSSEVAR